MFVEQPFRRARLFTATSLRGVLLYPAVVVLTLPLLAGADRVVEEQLTDGGPAITVTDFGQEPGDPEPEFSKDPFVALVEASVLAAENGFDIPAEPQARTAGPRRGPPGRGGVRVLRDQRGPPALPARRHRTGTGPWC